MGVKSFVHELKVKVSPSRLFKAFVHESPDVLPKASPTIKSIDIVEGSAIAPGCLYQINFPEGAPFKYLRNRVDVVDSDNYVLKFTTVEGAVLGDKLEKICNVLTLEASADGGCTVKLTSEYHTKGGAEISDEEAQGALDQASGLYKACEEYLTANPHVCA